MKAVVLAGGYATRMWPITRHRPKMFLPVGNSTVIDLIFDDLEADDRVDEVFISTNEYFAEEFQAHIDDSEYEKPTLSVEETRDEDEKFGVVGALAELVEREGVEDDLLIIAGDNLISFGLSDFIDEFEANDAPTLAAYDVGDLERAKSYGLVELDGDRVVDFQEKPDDPKSTLVSIACYAFPEATLELLSTYLDNDNNPDEPGWFIQWLQAREDTFAYPFEEAWFDIGTPASYLDAVAWHLDGQSLIADSATLENTNVGENVHIMADSTVEDVSIENSVIFPDATIRNGDVSDSIVDEGAVIDNLDLEDALIGAHTQISGE